MVPQLLTTRHQTAIIMAKASQASLMEHKKNLLCCLGALSRNFLLPSFLELLIPALREDVSIHNGGGICSRDCWDASVLLDLYPLHLGVSNLGVA